MSYKFSFIIEKEKSGFVLLCPEVDMVFRGKSVDEVLSRLKEFVRLHAEVHLAAEKAVEEFGERLKENE